MNANSKKAWLYLLPATLFLVFFLVYQLIDVFVYSVEEGYNFASQTYFGTGLYNFSYVLHDPYFLQAVKNTFILVIITVPVSTGLALLISTPFALGSAIFMTEIAPKFGEKFYRPVVQIFAGIPSVVYGWVGLTVLVPAIRDLFDLQVGHSLLAAGIVLAIMIFPTITSVSADAIRAVSKD